MTASHISRESDARLPLEMNHDRQQLLAHHPVQQLVLGDEVWSIQQLLVLLEYGVRSAPDLTSALEL